MPVVDVIVSREKLLEVPENVKDQIIKSFWQIGHN